ncbi:MAG TPA: ATP-dependent Clp protease adaptor ClpS [Tepidisphaeraceae bacterium]|nr:ATP-dependent Clp protease adaptor ClpS [Tepidisphaeraceae bacterium]
MPDAPGPATDRPSPAQGTQLKAKPNKPKPLPPFHVVLLNDDDHSYEYVIEMLRTLFGHPPEKGYQLADEVDRKGRAIVYTTHREKAELKCEQIHAFGTDERVATCVGSMSAFIEPAEG